MCGRMTIATAEEKLAARFHAEVTESIEKRYNAYPNHDRYTLPVILNPDAEAAWLNPDTTPEKALDILADPRAGRGHGSVPGSIERQPAGV